MADLLKDGQYESAIKSGGHGENFQKEVALTLFLRMRGCSSRFRLAYEVQKADKFDDVVLIDDGRKEIHFIQVKHADAKDDEVKNIDLDALFPTAGKANNKGDFDLCKYIKSYQIVNQRFEEGENEEKFARKYYVLTNRDLPITKIPKFKELVEKVEERKVHEILQFPKSKARHLKLIPTENAIKELGKQINNDFLEVEKAIEELFNSGTVGPVLKNYCTPLKDVLKIDKNKNCSFQEFFRSDSKQFSVASLYNKLKDKIDMTKQVIIRENFLQQNSRSNYLPPYISEDEIKDFFCNSFTLSVGHPNNLHPVIDSELRRWMKACIRPDILGKWSKKELDQVFTDLKKCFDKLNEPNKSKIKDAFKQSDVEKCLDEVRIANKNLESEESKEWQGYYINRMIVYKATPYLSDTKDSAISDTDFVGELRGTFKDHQHIVLLAEPGMGKTSLLRFLAFNMQKLNGVVDVFLVHLSGLVKELDKEERISDLDGVLRVLSAVLSEESCAIIKNTPAERDTKGYSIVMLFDGFDEIHSKYSYKFIKMLKRLTLKKSIQIIISSRMHVKQLLERTFTLRSMILQPFSEKDQIMYLKKMWKVEGEDYQIFENYSKQLLNIHPSIPSKLRDIFGLPLMMKMLAEIYFDQFEQYLEAVMMDNVQQDDFIKDNFNIVQLYEKFVRKCFHMKLVDKYKHCGDINDVELDSVIEGYILEHQLLAMRLLDFKIFTYLTENPHLKMKYDQFRNRCERESEKSLLVKVVDNNVQFCHLTYGEYFVAKYLCDNIFTLPAEHVIRIWSEHEVMRRLSMIKLGENEAFHKIFNTLCKSNRMVSLWACESGCLGMVSYLVRNFKSFTPKNLNMMLQVTAEIGNFEICKFLLENNCDPNRVDEKQKTALHLAAQNGHVAVVALLLQNNAKVDTRTNDKLTALHLAVSNGHATVVDLLLQNQAKVDAQSKNNSTALHLAAQNGYATVVDLLLQNRANADAQTNVQWTALHWAASEGHAAVVDLLIKNKVMVDAQTEQKWTALHLAAEKGHDTVVDLLIKNKATVDAQNEQKWTALHLGGQKGHHTVVDLLIKSKAKVDAQTEQKWTALHLAAQEGHDTVVDLLIKSKAKVDAQTVQKWTALHLAAQKGHDTVLDLLLQNQAKVDAQTNDKWTALHLAVSNGHATVINLLLQNNAKVDAQSDNKSTALHLAAKNGYFAIADLLLQKQAKVDAQTNDKWTALHLAAEKGQFTIVDLLLQKQAKVDAQTENKSTALHLAAKNGYFAIADLLLQKQAKVDAQTNDKWTALHLAAEKGQFTIVDLLLQKQAKVDAQTENKSTALHLAAQNGHATIVDLLIQNQANVDAQTNVQWTALHLAAEKGYATVVDLLIKNKANVDAQTENKATALHLAAQNGQDQVLELLIDNHANTNLWTSDRWSSETSCCIQ